jgi:hypothetical protein
MIEYTVKVYDNGTKTWYLNDKLHRTDGPAVEWTNGYKAWYLNGKRHREDGPAIEWSTGAKFWYINGKSLSEKEFNDRNKVELSLEEISEKFNIPIEQLRIKK